MVSQEPIVPPDLHLQVRKIRNIEIWRSDLLPLIVGNKKIPSTPINAFGAQLQELEGGATDFIIFSSWLGALAGGMAAEGPVNGTIKEYIKVAVSCEFPNKPQTKPHDKPVSNRFQPVFFTSIAMDNTTLWG
jgi:hypothetical protein